MIPPGSPPHPYHTPSLLPSVITTLFESLPVQKPLQVWFFWLGSSLTCLGRARKGNGWTSRSPFPRAGLGEASPVFFDSVELVREHSPSGSNKSSMWLHNWNCLTCLGTWSLIYSFFLFSFSFGKTTGKSVRSILRVRHVVRRGILSTPERNMKVHVRQTSPQNLTGQRDWRVV